MKFCSSCGSAHIEFKIPEGDNRLRYVCITCSQIFYNNPKIVTGCIAEWENKILLCKRAIEPQLDKWTLPAGFMENHETIIEAAVRESMEEANATVKNLSLFTVYNLPHINQVYIIFRGELVNGIASPGVESSEVALVTTREVPWKELAFPVIRESLELYLEDAKKNHFTLHMGDIYRTADRHLEIRRY